MNSTPARSNGKNVIPPGRPDGYPALLHVAFDRQMALLRGSKVPPQLHEGLARYFAAGILPGSFLLAVLSNDAASAIRRADDTCRAGYGEIVLFLAKHAPCNSWGSDENVAAWRAAFVTCVRCGKPGDLNFDGVCEGCVS